MTALIELDAAMSELGHSDDPSLRPLRTVLADLRRRAAGGLPDGGHTGLKTLEGQLELFRRELEQH